MLGQLLTCSAETIENLALAPHKERGSDEQYSESERRLAHHNVRVQHLGVQAT